MKKALRKVIPVRASVFERRHKELSRELQSINERIFATSEAIDRVSKQLETLAMQNMDDLEKHRKELSGQMASLSNIAEQNAREIEGVSKTLERTSSMLSQHSSVSRRIENLERESIWAETFQQTISTPAEWLKDTSFSPGRWAVGFPFLYAMYRILNEMKPHSILELGLGQTTKMIGQYAHYYPETHHDVVEHDGDWIEFWKDGNPNYGNSTIHLLDLTMISHDKASHDVRRYANFAEEFEGNTFVFISIDAPFGYDMKELARVDAVDLIPRSLRPSFAIIVDDYDRLGEQNMVKLLESRLNEADIEFTKGVYRGEKNALVVASVDNSFLCSM